MSQLSGRFGPIYASTILDASGNGTVSFTPNGSNAKITNVYVQCNTAVRQSVARTYRGNVAVNNGIGQTNSGSSGGNIRGVDLFDGETLWVVWTGGDVGATATATFSGSAPKA